MAFSLWEKVPEGRIRGLAPEVIRSLRRNVERRAH